VRRALVVLLSITACNAAGQQDAGTLADSGPVTDPNAPTCFDITVNALTTSGLGIWIVLGIDAGQTLGASFLAPTLSGNDFCYTSDPPRGDFLTVRAWMDPDGGSITACLNDPLSSDCAPAPDWIQFSTQIAEPAQQVTSLTVYLDGGLPVLLACGNGNYCSDTADVIQKIGTCSIDAGAFDESQCLAALDGSACSDADRQLLNAAGACDECAQVCQAGHEATFQQAIERCLVAAGFSAGLLPDGGIYSVPSLECLAALGGG
jgi:hypothetical protein